MMYTSKKISIIGAGKVGSATAFSLVHSGIATEIAIVDVFKEKAEGEVMDIMHGAPLLEPVKIYSGDYSAIKDSSIIIITAGANIVTNQSRLELLKDNVNIFKDIVSSMSKYIGSAIILVVSNPVDVMTYVTQKLTNLPRHKVIGSGTVLDTSRFKQILGEHLNVDPRDVRGYILGEHGDSEFATWSSTNVAGIPMEEYCDQLKVCTPDTTKENILNEVRRAGYEVIKRKGCTQYAVALAVTTIVKSILMNQRSVLTVSTLLEGEYEQDNVYLSVPCILNQHGIDQILHVPLCAEEKLQLDNSANILKDAIGSINL